MDELELIEQLYESFFTERERRLLANCEQYRAGFPGGLPGHNLMILASKMDELLGLLSSYITDEDLKKVIVESDEFK